MRRFSISLAVALALLPADVVADGSSGVYGLCESATSNASPAFTTANYPASSRTGVMVTSDNKLQLQTGAQALDLNNPVILPTDQDLTAQMIFDHAGDGASNTLGWFYYDDLVRLGFINEGCGHSGVRERGHRITRRAGVFPWEGAGGSLSSLKRERWLRRRSSCS